jgi:hypothetical protein
MTETPQTVIITTLAWIALWTAALLLALALPSIFRRSVPFVEVLKKQWKASLCIAGVYLASTLLGGRGIFNPYVLAVFSQAMFGLAIAQGIPNFQALRMSKTLLQRRKIADDFFAGLLVAAVVVVPAIVVGTRGIYTAGAVTRLRCWPTP